MQRPGILSLILLLTASLWPTRGDAQASEDAVKAAFLPRFARYVAWPAGTLANAPAVQLCVIGVDPLGRLLDQAVSGQTVDGKPIVIRRMATPERAEGCHLAFVQGQSVTTGLMLAALRRLPVLTVTDSRSGPQRGIIHFVVVGGRVRFFIDEASAAARGMGVNARLLALALGVRQTGG
jgi:hypothetical protein